MIEHGTINNTSCNTVYCARCYWKVTFSRFSIWLAVPNSPLLQWGTAQPDSSYDIYYVLPLTTTFCCICEDGGSTMESSQVPQIVGFGLNGFKVYERFIESHQITPIKDTYIIWFAIGY